MTIHVISRPSNSKVWPGGGSSWWSAPPAPPPTRPQPSGRLCTLECQCQEPSPPGWQSSQIYPDIWYRLLTFMTVATSAPPTILRPHALFPSLSISSSTTWQHSWKLIWGQRIRNLVRICQCLEKYHSTFFIFFFIGFQMTYPVEYFSILFLTIKNVKMWPEILRNVI